MAFANPSYSDIPATTTTIERRSRKVADNDLLPVAAQDVIAAVLRGVDLSFQRAYNRAALHHPEVDLEGAR